MVAQEARALAGKTADVQDAAEAVSSGNSEAEEAKQKPQRREIKGGLPYTTAPGVFKRALEGIISAERPDKFSGDFMSTILKLTGGSARQVPPLLKKMRFISSDGTPTELYSKFKSESARSNAAYEGLRNAFSEMFRRNDFIHKADDSKVVDLIVEITGLRRNDPIVRYTNQTFDAMRSFVEKNFSMQSERQAGEEDKDRVDIPEEQDRVGVKSVGLSYNINIVLPETENVAVFNAIFRSLKSNLLS